jgi:lysophospholipase L1-like esterase
MERKNDPARPRAATEPFRARLRAWIHVCRAFGIEPVLMTQPLTSSRNWLTPEWADLGNQDVFNAITRQVGEEEGVPVIDLVRHLQEDVPGWDEPERLFFDGMHVNDEGSRVLSKFMSAALLPLAQKAQRENAATATSTPAGDR